MYGHNSLLEAYIFFNELLNRDDFFYEAWRDLGPNL